MTTPSAPARPPKGHGSRGAWAVFVPILLLLAGALLYFGFKQVQNSTNCSSMSSESSTPGPVSFLYLAEVAGNTNDWSTGVSEFFAQTAAAAQFPVDAPLKVSVRFFINGRAYSPVSDCLSQTRVLEGAVRDVELFRDNTDPAAQTQGGNRLARERARQIRVIADEIKAVVAQIDFSAVKDQLTYTPLPLWIDAASYAQDSLDFPAVALYSPLQSNAGDCLDMTSGTYVTPSELVADCATFGDLQQIQNVRAFRIDYPGFFLANAGQRVFANKMIEALCGMISAEDCR